MAKLPINAYGPTGLALTDAQFHELHVKLDKTRRSSTTVTVDRRALAALLSDHAKLYAHIDQVEHQLRHGGGE